MEFGTKSSRMLESGLDATWLKMRLHMDNIANYETPGYKAKQISFDEVIKGCLSPKHGGTHSPNVTKYVATVWKDENTEARVDGNNVSMEKEQLELFKAQAQYAYLTQKISGHYGNLGNVISAMSK